MRLARGDFRLTRLIGPNGHPAVQGQVVVARADFR